MKVSTKEMWLSAIKMRPLDRIPFWPKLWTDYPPFQREPFCKMSLPELHQWIGSDYHQMPSVPLCAKQTSNKCNLQLSRSPEKTVLEYVTPGGTVSFISECDKGSGSWHPVKHPVNSLDDIKIMTEYLRDINVSLDEENLDKANSQAETIGLSGLISVNCGTSPLMDWVENLAGVENAHYLLMDYQEDVDHLFDAMHQINLAVTELQAKYHPADMLSFNENTSTALISPHQYRQYCVRHISEYTNIIRRHNRLVFLHMCGHLKDLLPDLATLDVDAFEAFTPPPLANTTLCEGRKACPDKCLIGGTSALHWAKSADDIIAVIKGYLDELPHHRGIVITSGGAMPPDVPPEKIKQVCEWLKTYPAQM